MTVYYNEIDVYCASWLRAYGNAIVPQAAAEFIGAFAEARGLIADRREVAT